MSELEANFAFGLWSNQWKPINLTDVAEYVQIQATMLNFEYDDSKGLTETILPLGIHPCNDTDIFFEPVINQKNSIPVVKQYAFCIDNLNDQKFWGNSESGIYNALQVRLAKCDSAEHNNKCKSDDEINEWLDLNGHFTFLANE